MKKTIGLAILSLSILLFQGCATTASKIEAMRPEPDDATPLLYETEASFIDLPVQLKLRDIQNQTNKFLNGLIYEDKDFKGDDLAVSIWKTAPISITNENGKIKTVFPMKALVKYKIGTDRFGVDMSTIREFNLNGKITLVSDVALSNWQMKTKTQLKSIDWNESPSTTIMGQQVPITHFLNPALKFFRSSIEESLDEAIAKSMDFKPNVLDALDKMTVPFQMNEQYDTWLRVVPVELYSTNAKIEKDVVLLEMGMKCNIESFIGRKPESGFNRNNIVLKAVSKMPDHFTANILAISAYEDAARVISGNFVGQEFGSGSKKVKVTKVALWHKAGKLIVAMDLLGSLNGTVYLSGIPKYDGAKKEIFIDQLDYAVDTKSRLVRTANWMASGYILEKMQELCRYNITPNIEEGKKSAMTYLTNYSPMKGVFVNGSIQSVDFTKVTLTNRAIVALMNAKGKIDIKVDGLE